jgi:hypothetical protein
MKRAGILGLAVALMLGMAITASHAANTKKIATEAEVEGIRFPTDTEIEFFGDVHSLKSKCEKGRDVTLVYNGPNKADHFVGTDTTDETGDWEVRHGESGLAAGNYAVEVAKKTFKKHGRKFVCKATTSPNKEIGD